MGKLSVRRPSGLKHLIRLERTQGSKPAYNKRQSHMNRRLFIVSAGQLATTLLPATAAAETRSPETPSAESVQEKHQEQPQKKRRYLFDFL